MQALSVKSIAGTPLSGPKRSQTRVQPRVGAVKVRLIHLLRLIDAAMARNRRGKRQPPAAAHQKRRPLEKEGCGTRVRPALPLLFLPTVHSS